MLTQLINRQSLSIDFHGQNRSWTNSFLTTQSLGHQRVPLLERYYDTWSNLHVHYGAKDNGVDLSMLFIEQNSDSSMLVPTDDDTALIDVWKDGKHVKFHEFLERFEFKGQVTPKHMKRLKRLMRLSLQGQYAFLNPQEIRIRWLNVDEKVYDGPVIFSRSFVEKIVKNADYTGMNARERQRMKAMMRNATIGYPTLAYGEAFCESVPLPKGTVKGMAHVAQDDVFLVRDVDTGEILDTHVDFDILLPRGAIKKELLVNDDQLFFVDFRPTHGKDDKVIDFGTLSSKWKFFELDNLKQWLKDDAITFLQSVYDEKERLHPSSIRSAHAFEQSEAWVLGQYLLSGGSPMASVKMLQKVFNQFEQEMVKRRSKNRIPSKAQWRYLAPYTIYMGLNPLAQPIPEEHAFVGNDCLYIHDRTLIKVYKSTGGGDGDDPVIITFYQYKGKIKMLINRNPNAENEYYLLHPTEDSLVPMDVPELDEANLQPQYLVCEPKPMKLEKHQNNFWLDTGFTPKEAVLMAKTLNSSLGVLGQVCNVTYLEGVLGLESTLPFPMENVVDGTTQEGVDMRPALEWARMRTNEIVYNHPIPKTILPRIINIMSSEMMEFIVIAEDHWLDNLMETDTTIQKHLMGYDNHGEFVPGQLHELSKRIKPAGELMQAGQPFQALGKEYNMAFWTQYQAQRELVAGLKQSLEGYDDEPLPIIGGLLSVQWEDLTAFAEAYVLTHDMPHELLLGTYYHIHSRGKDVPSETPLWLGQVGGVMLEAMRKVGYLHELSWDDTKGVVQTKREYIPSNKVSIAIRNVGSNVMKRKGVNQQMLDYIRSGLTETEWEGTVWYTELDDNNNVIITNGNITLGWLGKAGTTSLDPDKILTIHNVDFVDSKLRLNNQEFDDFTIIALVTVE